MASRAKRITAPDGRVRVRSKAANGEGSVYREADGTWRATYWLPGESKPRRVRGRTRAIALERRDVAVERAAGSGNRFSPNTTVAELARWWLEHEAANRVRPTSLGAIAGRLTAARLGSLGSAEVGALTVEQVAEWQTGLLRSGLAPKTVRDTRSTVRQVIDAAVDHGLASGNVVARVKPPRAEKRPGRALDAAEARRLVAECASSRYGVAVALLFAQGWRVSEVLGLAWQDLDLDAGTATLRRAVVEAKGAGRTLGPPKTEGSIGVHQLTPGVVDRLRVHNEGQAVERAAVGDVWPQIFYDGRLLDLVFVQPDGNLVARQHIDRLMRTAAARIGIDATNLGTHVGRRSVVTGLYLAGEALDDIARHVGHRSTSTTAGYVATLGDRPKRTAARAAELFD